MFWNRKPKSPITTEDEAWIVECYHWLEEAFERNLSTQEIYLPTKSFLDFDYTGSEDDAIEIVNIISEKLEIKGSSIEVYFFDEFQPIAFTDEGIYSNYEEGTQLTNGLYSKVIDGIYQIGIESSLLKDPVKLVATAAHELSHIKLIGEERLEENDEPLTDLTASLFGFVVFMANSSISKMATWSGNTHAGWQIGGSSGYLHYKLYAFLIAFWMTRRNEKNPDWLNYLDKEILNTVRKSAKYLASKGN